MFWADFYFAKSNRTAALRASSALGLFSRRIKGLLGLLLFIACGSAAQAEIVRPGDSIWEINSRRLPQCMPVDCSARLAVWQLEGSCWQASAEDSLIELAMHEPMRTVIYIHGNWMPVNETRTRALMVYRMISARSAEPIRFIVFSWPSEQRERPAKDVITKKPLLATSSFYLASFVQRLPAEQPLSILGYSFGGAIVTGSLHLLAGGDLDGYCLCDQTPRLQPIRVGLAAPAFDQFALGPSGRYSRALEMVDYLHNLYNSRDPILRRFRFFDRDNDPVAAGFAGLSATLAVLPLEANEKIEQVDCCSVGRSHYEVAYFSCGGFQKLIATLLAQ